LDTIKFEGVKTGLRQSKDGYMLSIAVHPDDIPDDLVKDFVGSRYMVVMVRLDDEDKPVVRAHHPAVSMAGMLCREPEFWGYVSMKFNEEINSEGECAEWFKFHFDIGSRAELKTNKEASAAFVKLKEGYEAWKNN
jgi:hypothetical protein